MPKIPNGVRTERSPIRFKTPYLEVEARSIPSLEPTITRDPTRVSHTAARKASKPGARPSHRMS